MPCCDGIDVAEDIHLSKTMKKAVRSMYYRDKNYLDVLRKIEQREIGIQPIFVPGGGMMYKVLGHNTYIKTEDGTRNGRIIAIAKPGHAENDERYRLTFYYAFHRHTEFYGNVVKTEKFGHTNNFISNGSMKSLDGRTEVVASDFYDARTGNSCVNRTLNEDGVDIADNYPVPQDNFFNCSGRGITRSGNPNELYIYLCNERYGLFENETIDQRNQLRPGLRNGDLFFPRVFLPRFGHTFCNSGNYGTGLHWSEDVIISNGNILYNQDEAKKGVKVRFNVETGELYTFKDGNQWKTLDNDTNYIRFRSLLRAELLHNVDSKEDPRYKAYEIFIKWFGLRSKFQEIEKRIDTRQEFLNYRAEENKKDNKRNIKNKNHRLNVIDRANINLDSVSEDKKSVNSVKNDDNLNLNIKKNRKQKNEQTLRKDIILIKKKKHKDLRKGSVMSNDDLNRRVANFNINIPS